MGETESRQLLVHLTLVQTLHSQTIQNGYFFTNRSAMDLTPQSGLVPQLISHFTLFILPYLKQVQSQELVYRSMVASTLLPENGPIAEQILETSQGDQTFESLPSYSAACLTLRTGFGGKSYRGRSYYSGVSAEHTGQSRLDANLLTGFQNLGNQLVNTFGNTGGISPFVYCIFSRKRGTNEGGGRNYLGISPITQVVARSILCTQRHRKIGIGN